MKKKNAAEQQKFSAPVGSFPKGKVTLLCSLPNLILGGDQ